MKSKAKSVQDPGFGVNITQTRLVNRDGSFNVNRLGGPFWKRFEPFHFLVTTTITKFTLLLLGGFVMINLLFASIYYLMGPESLMGVIGRSSHEHFWEAFFFSTQTLTTLGYGRISPVGFWPSMIAAFESMLGLLTFALATGLLYGRFSQPRANVSYSGSVLMSPYKDINSLQFRLVNLRKISMVDAEVSVLLAVVEEQNGKTLRRFYPLDLERKTISYLSLNWTVVHPISPESPFYKLSLDEIKDREMELMVTLKGYDEVFSNIVYSRTSYNAHQFIEGARFVSMFDAREDGVINLYLDRLNVWEEAKLNESVILDSESETVRS